MAIKILNYAVDTESIKPNTEQYAGMQGDHRVTQLLFTVSDSLYFELTKAAQNSKIMYRFDIYNGEGGMWSSEVREFVDTNVTVELEECHTRYGGKITVYLIITALSPENETEIELYSFPAVLRLTNRPDGIIQEGEDYESISSLSKIASDNAETAKSSAESAAESADIAKEYAKNIYSHMETAVETARVLCMPMPSYEDTTGIEKVFVYDDNRGYFEENDGSRFVNREAFAPRRIDDGQSLSKNIDGKTETAKRAKWLAARDRNGNLWTGTPIDDQDCVTKKYINEKIDEIVKEDIAIKDRLDSLDGDIAVKLSDININHTQLAGKVDALESSTNETASELEEKIDFLETDVNGMATALTTVQIEQTQLREQKQDKLTAGKGITISDNNVISASGGGSGTDDYEQLENKPKINGTELVGNKSLVDLGVVIPPTDQTYNSLSENAQSGKAVAEAIEPISDYVSGMAGAVNTLQNQLASEYYTKSEIDEKTDWKTLADVTTQEDTHLFDFNFENVSELIVMISGTTTHARVNFFSDGMTNFYHYTFLTANQKRSNYMHIHKRMGGMRYIESGNPSTSIPDTKPAYELVGSTSYGVLDYSENDVINNLKFEINSNTDVLKSGARIQIFGR